MIKIIMLLVAAALSCVECYFLPISSLLIKILLFVLFIIANVILEVGLFFIVVFLLGLPINTKKETTHYSKFYRYVLYVSTKICLSLFSIKVKVEGLEKIPQNTNFVILYNHISNLDTMVMDVYLHKYPLVFVAKKSLFKIPFFGKMLHRIGYISLDRGNIRQELKAIYQGIDFLNKNECSVGVSPEGTRNFTNQTLLPFKVGCLHLATETKRPIIISVIKGTNEVKHNLFFKKHQVSFKIVDVIDYNIYKDFSRKELAKIIENKMLEELLK